MSTGIAPDGGAEETPDRWEQVGRHLLAEQLEVVAMETVRDAFIGARGRLNAGEELTQEDIDDLRRALEQAQHVVDLAATASPDTAPAPDLWSFLDDEAREDYLRKASREQ